MPFTGKNYWRYKEKIQALKARGFRPRTFAIPLNGKSSLINKRNWPKRSKRLEKSPFKRRPKEEPKLATKGSKGWRWP
jgi:hypothetical protein